MRSFKKINLALLTALAMTTQVSGASEFTIEVDGTSNYSDLLGVATAHKTGNGTLIFSGTDNAIGLLDIRAGTVNISTSTNLHSTTPAVGFSTTANGTLGITANITDPIACILGVNGNVSVSDNRTGQLGALTGAYTLTKAGAGTLAIGSNIDNHESGSTIAVSAGTLSVAAAQNLPAITSLRGGTLQVTSTLTTSRAINLTADSSVLVDNSVITTLGSDGMLTGAYRLTKSGTGTLALTGDKSESTTAFTVLAGTLSISNANQLPHGEETGALTLAAGTLAATDDVVMPIAVALTGDANLSTGAHAVTIGLGLSGDHTLTKSGSGSLILGGNNSEATTALTISAGTLSIGAGNNLPAGLLTLAGSTTLATTADSVIIPIAVAMTGNSTLSTDTHPVTIGGAITGGFMLTKQGASALNVTSNISGVSEISVATTAGSLVAGGALSLPVTTTLANGTTLSLGAEGIANTGAVTSTVAVPNSASAILAGTATGFAASNEGASHTIVKTGDGTLVLTGDKSGSNSAITVTGGVLSVSAANQFPGGTATLNGGTLAISSAITNSKPLVVSASSTLDNALAVTQSGAITGTALLTKSGVGTLIMGATIAAPVSVTAGTLSVASGANFPSTTTLAGGTTLEVSAAITNANAIALAGNSTLAIGANNVTHSGAITGSSILSKTGAGTLTISGDKSGSLSTIAVSTGTLRVSDADNFPAAVTVASGATLETTGEVVTFGKTLTFASGSTLKLGGDWAKAITVSE